MRAPDSVRASVFASCKALRKKLLTGAFCACILFAQQHGTLMIVGNKRLDREQHRKLLAALADALTSKNARTRKYVAYAICEYISGADTLPPSLVPRLVCRLKDSNEQVRDICSTALKRLATPREDILVKLLTDKSDAVRIEAVQAFGVLAAMNKPHHQAIPPLLRMLSAANKDVRYHAAVTLSKLVESAEQKDILLQPLLKGLRDTDERVAVVCRLSLVKLRADAVPALRKLLGHSDPTLRRHAVRALADMASQSRRPSEVADALREASRSSDKQISAAAKTALRSIESSRKP